MKSDAESLVTICKFFFNNLQRNDNGNQILSRTLMKVAVISREWWVKNEIKPQHGEFWKCKIIKETCVGRSAGCFILEPICIIKVDEIMKLITGLYTEHYSKGLLVIKPTDPSMNWILPLAHKKAIQKVYSIIVELSE